MAKGKGRRGGGPPPGNSWKKFLFGSPIRTLVLIAILVFMSVSGILSMIVYQIARELGIALRSATIGFANEFGPALGSLLQMALIIAVIVFLTKRFILRR